MKYLRLFESITDIEEIKSYLHDIQDLGIEVNITKESGINPRIKIEAEQITVDIKSSTEMFSIASEFFERMSGFGYKLIRNNYEDYFGRIEFTWIFEKSNHKKQILPKIKPGYDAFKNALIQEFNLSDDIEENSSIKIYDSRYLEVSIEFQGEARFQSGNSKVYVIMDPAIEYDIKDQLDACGLSEEDGSQKDKDGTWIYEILESDNKYDLTQKTLDMLKKLVALLEKYNVGNK